jgi:hypothetical protein
MSFLTKLIRSVVQSPSTAIRSQPSTTRNQSGRTEPPKELDWSQADYIPLPPSPEKWEVDGRDDYHRDLADPKIGPVMKAGLAGEHTKLIKLATELTPEQRTGQVGYAIVQAYRKLINQKMKAGQRLAAAKQSLEMFEQVPDRIDDVDKRRFNRILAALDKAGKKHKFTACEVGS